MHAPVSSTVPAFKYSPPQSTIKMNIFQKNAHFIFEIVDEGIGILPEDQKRLFEPFQRGINVSSVHGTGLGLSIVKEMIQLHGGTISFDSQQDVGTSFSVVIPIQNSSCN